MIIEWGERTFTVKAEKSYMRTSAFITDLIKELEPKLGRLARHKRDGRYMLKTPHGEPLRVVVVRLEAMPKQILINKGEPITFYYYK